MTRLLSQGEAAEFLGVSGATLARFRAGRAGVQGPTFVKYERTVRYKTDDLEEWIEERRVECVVASDRKTVKA